jgi:uncharacterized protein
VGGDLRNESPPTRLADARHPPHRFAGGGIRDAARAVAIASLVLLAIMFAVGIALAQSLTFPELSGRVVDDAGILDFDTRQKLERLSADLEAKTTDQLVVVTLKSLQGTSIEDYGYQLGRKWQIGQKDKNNGVVLIVAPTDRRVRIEVGYGLEPTLTDAISSVIIQGSILPRFRAGDFAGGTLRGAQDIVQVLTGDAAEYRERAVRREQAAARTLTPAEMLIMAFWIFVAIMIVWNVVADMRGRNRPLSSGSVRRTRDWTDYNPVIIGGGSSSGSSWGGGGGGGGFSGGGGSFGGGGSSGSW